METKKQLLLFSGALPSYLNSSRFLTFDLSVQNSVENGSLYSSQIQSVDVAGEGQFAVVTEKV